MEYSIARSRHDLPIDPTTIDDILYTNLPRQLLMMLSRTAVLELHVARLEGLLGDSPHERFQRFIERLRRPDVTSPCSRSIRFWSASWSSASISG